MLICVQGALPRHSGSGQAKNMLPVGDDAADWSKVLADFLAILLKIVAPNEFH